MSPTESGIIRIASQHSVAATLERLEAALRAREVKIFARIDFSGDASRAGLTLRAEQMLIFGNPKAGTPLMQAAQTIGIDLPLKVLVWQDAAGDTWLSYNDPQWIAKRHGLGQQDEATVSAMSAALGALAAIVGGPR